MPLHYDDATVDDLISAVLAGLPSVPTDGSPSTMEEQGGMRYPPDLFGHPVTGYDAELPTVPSDNPGVDNDGLEPGEIASSPSNMTPFPRYLDASNAPGGVKAVLTATAGREPKPPSIKPSQQHRLPPGPSPEQGTPQDRLKTLVLKTAQPTPPTGTQTAATGPDTRYPIPVMAGEYRGQGGSNQGSGNQAPAIHASRVALISRDRSNMAATKPPRVAQAGNVPTTSAVLQQRRAQKPEMAGMGSSSSPARAPHMSSPARASYMSPTALVSLWCQENHFNPEWRVVQTDTGRYCCDVILKDRLVKGKASFESQGDAKYSTARRALRLMEGWLRPPSFGKVNLTGPPPSSPTVRENPPATKQENNGVEMVHRSRRKTPMACHAERATIIANANADAGRDNIVAHNDSSLIDMVAKNLGVSLPGRARSNPETARAFLEGVAIGSGLLGASIAGHMSQAARSGTRGRLERSRSPVQKQRSDNERYRTRSPTGARARVTSPPQYINFLGRPSSDRYRPVETTVDQRGRTTIEQVLSRGPSGQTWDHGGFYKQHGF
ncbi:hypothetical protein B0H66DRAFT_526498 [Apodospora peruviana]|uniref:Uncharacterized protein n=1 Tax=Apodospora peruviana TaxID=516989 RepID=A0AAE0MEC9_9PEZI|nr:hypothetical protein B0H66DRAFT_526498 [Apodospora peruviana]